MRVAAGSIILLCLAGSAAYAADYTTPADGSGFLTFSASLGYLSGQAHELVYNEDGSKLSELVWDMNHALALNGGVALALTGRLSLYGNATLGLAADNSMDDYDWEEAPPPADPDYHSWHPDTELDHYVTLDAGAAFAFIDTGSNSLSLLGGFKYTDVKWTAFGGCYDYPDDQGCFPDREKAISFQLRLPAAYAGLGYAGSYDQLSWALEGRGGMTISAEAEDDHWMRDLNFLDSLDSEPYLAVIGKVAYAVNDMAGITVSAAYDKFYEMKGSTVVTDTSTGTKDRYEYDADAASLDTLNLAIGFDLKL